MTSTTFARRLAGALAILVPAFLPACTAATETTETAEQDIRFSPTDSEHWARFTLALPTGTCLPGNSCGRPLGTAPSITIDGTSVSLGATTRLKPGDHALAANGNSVKITLAADEI